jgi:hypothetical protein
MKLASRSAMLSESSLKAGSRAASGSGEVLLIDALGVVCEARRLVRERERSGVVGRDGRARERDRLRSRGVSGSGVRIVVIVADVVVGFSWKMDR